MENGAEVRVSIDIKGFAHNRMLLAILSDATLNDDPATLRLTYHYYPTKKEDVLMNTNIEFFKGLKRRTIYPLSSPILKSKSHPRYKRC
ncbi:ATP-dependent endonuclease of the OLD family [Cytobacillus firmus]|nr:ATP-dependent endonuclease of the OLD family [Cytobacillus firmus]